MCISRRLLTVTQGNINNNHLYLTTVLDMFPKDVFGGEDRSQAAARMVRIECGSETVETDIVDAKNIFRKRGWVRRFFGSKRIHAGDQVVLEQIQPYSYRVWFSGLDSTKPEPTESGCQGKPTR